MRFHLDSLKNLQSSWLQCFVAFFASFSKPVYTLNLGSTLWFILLQRKVTALIPPTIVLLPLLLLLLKSSNLFSILIFLNILNLILSFQIISMASVRQDLLVIFFHILPMSGLPLYGTLVNPMSSLLISPRLLIESGTRLC